MMRRSEMSSRGLTTTRRYAAASFTSLRSKNCVPPNSRYGMPVDAQLVLDELGLQVRAIQHGHVAIRHAILGEIADLVGDEARLVAGIGRRCTRRTLSPGPRAARSVFSWRLCALCAMAALATSSTCARER